MSILAEAIKRVLSGDMLPGANMSLYIKDYFTNRYGTSGATEPPEPPPPPLYAIGPHAYLNDRWEQGPATQTRIASEIAALHYPRLSMTDTWGVPASQSNWQSMLDIGASTATSISSVYANRLFMCKLTTDEAQLNLNTFPGAHLNSFVASSSSRALLNLCPKHVLFKVGAALGGPGLSASDPTVVTNYPITQQVDPETVPGWALIRPGVSDWGAIVGGVYTELEWIYVTRVSGGTMDFTRGWRSYKFQDASFKRNHSPSAYIAFACGGGAYMTSNLVAGNGNPANTKFNLKYNISTQCPLDAAGKTIADYVLEFGQYKIDAYMASSGRYPDGLINDVDFPYLFNWNGYVSRADCNNDGVVDYGLSSLNANPTNYWGDGRLALDTRFIAAFGPGTPYNMAIFTSGAITSMPTGGSGREDEGAFADQNWQAPCTYLKINGKILMAHFWARRGTPLAPRLSMPLFRGKTKIHPAPQIESSPANPNGNNRDWRLNFALSQILGQFMSLPMSGSTTYPEVNHYDSLAVNVENNAYAAVPYYDMNPDGSANLFSANNTKATALLPHRKWMGAALADFVRIYSSEDMDISRNIMPVSFENSAPLVILTGVTSSWISDATSPNGNGYTRYRCSSHGLQAGSNAVTISLSGLTSGTEYTLVGYFKSDRVRVIEWNPGNGDTNLVPIDTFWLNYILGFRATSSSHSMKLNLGMYSGDLHVARMYLFRGSASVFARDFQRALLIANPTPTAKTVPLPTGMVYKRINGIQDRDADNGAIVSNTITIPAYDAAILGKVI